VRIVFMGTPAFAVPTLRQLAAAPGMEVTAVVCQPDRPAGRGGQLRPPAVKLAAQELGLPVFQPLRMRGEEPLAWLRAQRPGVLAVVAFGQLLPPAVFNLPRWGAVNAHASLLPAYRGAAPIQWALANGETTTGVTTMQIDAGLDTGAMLEQRAVPIGPDETAPELSARLAELAADLMVATLRSLEKGTLVACPQPEGATLAPLLTRADGRADWSAPASVLYNRWRGFQPWPGLHTTFRDKQLTIVRCRPRAGQAAPGLLVECDGTPAVGCGQGLLALEEVRLEGKQAVSGAAFANGARLAWGTDHLV
jgi:methionyl-tRNA formyltransferase